MTVWARIISGVAVLAAIAHLVYVQRFSGREVLRLDVPIPAEGSSDGHALARVQLSSESNPVRALCDVDVLQVTFGAGPVSKTVGSYRVEIVVRSPSDFWRWERSDSSSTQSGSTGVEVSGGPRTIDVGTFSVPADGIYLVEAWVREARLLRSASVSLRAGTRKYSFRLLAGCAGVFLLAWFFGRKPSLA
jgi:hypothetical protein